jgi:gluconate 2-dehydrogenase gamma chain
MGDGGLRDATRTSQGQHLLPVGDVGFAGQAGREVAKPVRYCCNEIHTVRQDEQHAMNDRNNAVSRRTFLNRVTVLGGLMAAYPAAALAALRNGASAAVDVDGWSSAEPWKTLNAVQRHLFPGSDDTPGAGDIGALRYLHTAIENPAADGEDRTFIFNGVGWLNDLTRETYQRPFVELDEQQRERVLRQIEESRAGRNWLSLLLTYLLEALLADPVYGGNPQGVGWRWLAHQPGYPTPPRDKVWYRVGEGVMVQRRRSDNRRLG